MLSFYKKLNIVKKLRQNGKFEKNFGKEVFEVFEVFEVWEIDRFNWFKRFNKFNVFKRLKLFSILRCCILKMISFRFMHSTPNAKHQTFWIQDMISFRFIQHQTTNNKQQTSQTSKTSQTS